MSEVFDISALQARPVLKPLSAAEAVAVVHAMKTLQTELAELRKLVRAATPAVAPAAAPNTVQPN